MSDGSKYRYSSRYFFFIRCIFFKHTNETLFFFSRGYTAFFCKGHGSVMPLSVLFAPSTRGVLFLLRILVLLYARGSRIGLCCLPPAHGVYFFYCEYAYYCMQEGHASVCAVCPQHTGCTIASHMGTSSVGGDLLLPMRRGRRLG
jgi:hypothetical protein